MCINGNLTSTEAGVFQHEAFEITSLLMVYCWEKHDNGARVDGQRYSWITMERWGPMRGMYGTLEAELEVQCTIKRAELTAFLCLLKKATGPTMDHVD